MTTAPALVTVHPPGTTIELRAGEALLDGLRRHGYSHRHGCRRGGCGQCKVDVLAGEVGYDVAIADSVLSPEEKQADGAVVPGRGPVRSSRHRAEERNAALLLPLAAHRAAAAARPRTGPAAITTRARHPPVKARNPPWAS